MEKMIHDTYALWENARVHIGADTRVCIDDPVVASQLDTIKEQGIPSAVSQICFSAITADVLDKVKDAFPAAEDPVPDSYIVLVEEKAIRVFSDTPNGIRYAVCAIRSHYDRGISVGILYNVPLVPFRAMKVYIPARENIPFFRGFVQMCMHYGYNTLIMEVGGAMEYKRHPEINEGWVEYAQIFQEYPRKSDDVQRCMPWLKDSIHWENGGGSYLTQEEIKELIAYCKAYGLNVIPEVPSLSHSDYLLTRHPELAENSEDPVPDTYCPSNPATYELLFDILEEVLEVFRPKTIHMAHDEWHTACLCNRCKGKDPGVLFADDVNRIHRWLKARGVSTMIWGDMLVKFVDKYGGIRGAGMKVRKIPLDRFVDIRGKTYRCHREIWGKTALEMEEGHLYCAPDSSSALGLVDRDVVVMNWLHHYNKMTDKMYMDAGHRCVIGNFYPRNFEDWYGSVQRGIEGVSISNWSMLDERHMQRNLILFYMAYGSMMLWNRDFREEDCERNAYLVANDLYRYHYRDAFSGPRAEIVHAATVTIPHEPFVDGNCMNEEADCMGCYRVEYVDGTTEDFNVFWGLNIGIQTPWMPQKKELGYLDMPFLEPTYTCGLEINENLTWYRLLIPLKKKAVRIVPRIMEQFRDAVKIRSIEIIDH